MSQRDNYKAYLSSIAILVKLEFQKRVGRERKDYLSGLVRNEPRFKIPLLRPVTDIKTLSI